MNCPLCDNIKLTEIKTLSGKIYFECGDCHLVFLHPHQRLDKKEEFARYAYHRNNINDKGYVKFLDQIIVPALKYINNSMTGLDFGCGPDPVLTKLLDLYKIKCDYYDPCFFNYLKTDFKYDFVFATECFEHFFHPSSELKIISSALRKNGILAIMTEFYTDIKNFNDWYYIKDPTHVCFYNLQVFDYICRNYGYEKLYSDNKRVIILKKI
jgi:hypothetical protein